MTYERSIINLILNFEYDTNTIIFLLVNLIAINKYIPIYNDNNLLSSELRVMIQIY